MNRDVPMLESPVAAKNISVLSVFFSQIKASKQRSLASSQIYLSIEVDMQFHDVVNVFFQVPFEGWTVVAL